MYAKVTLVLCTFALFVQSGAGQCLGRWGGVLGGCDAGWGYEGLGYGGCGECLGCDGIGLGAATGSPFAPIGLNILSENVYEGCVGVRGELPFLGTADVEGVFPTLGVGAISYRCGDGAVGIIAEDPVEEDYGYGAGLGYGYGLGYGAGFGYGLGGYGRSGSYSYLY